MTPNAESGRKYADSAFLRAYCAIYLQLLQKYKVKYLYLIAKATKQVSLINDL